MKPKWNFFLFLGSSMCQVFSSFFVTNSYWSIVALQCCVSLCSTEKISHPCVHIVVESLSRVWLFAIPWIVARQAPLSMGFPRQENWSGFPFPAPGGLLDLGVEPHISWHLLHGQAVSLPPSHQGRQYVYVYPFFPSHWSHHRSLSRVLYATQWFSLMVYFTHTGAGGGLVSEACLTLATQWTVACQAPLCMGFSRQEYWSGLPFPSPFIYSIIM